MHVPLSEFQVPILECYNFNIVISIICHSIQSCVLGQSFILTSLMTSKMYSCQVSQEWTILVGVITF